MPFKRHYLQSLTQGCQIHQHAPTPKEHTHPAVRLPPGPSHSLLVCLRTGPSLRASAAHACAHAHTQNHAPSNPSVSESRLSEMKVQSPGTESQPSKNVPFSQTEEICRGGVCFSARPEGLGLSPPRPDPSCKAKVPTAASGPAPRAPTRPLPFLAGEGRASLGVTPAVQEGMPWSTPPPPPPRHHIFTFGCFFFPFFPCQENQVLAPTPDLPPTLN